MSHTLKMLVGCLAPLLLIFALPLMGVSASTSIWLFLILMFGCHLFMMRGHHGADGHASHNRSGKGKE